MLAEAPQFSLTIPSDFSRQARLTPHAATQWPRCPATLAQLTLSSLDHPQQLVRWHCCYAQVLGAIKKKMTGQKHGNSWGPP